MILEHRWARLLGPDHAIRASLYALRMQNHARHERMRSVVRALEAVGTCPGYIPTASALVLDRMQLDPFRFS